MIHLWLDQRLVSAVPRSETVSGERRHEQETFGLGASVLASFLASLLGGSTLIVSSKTCSCLRSGWIAAEDFAVAITTTPLKFVGIDLKVVAYTPMKVSTMCLVRVESVFLEGGGV